MKRKWVLLACLMICLSIAGVLYYQYHAPRANVARIKASYSLAAQNVYDEFASDETTANNKYTGKIIEVAGIISEVQEIDSTAMILMVGANSLGGINCMMQKDVVTLPVVGDSIIIKGRCTGYLMDVNLVDAMIIKRF